jgi:CDP-glucose 4,6-dehydratase
MFGDFYPGRRILVTGHTGFKGGWLAVWLKKLGAVVHGLSLPAPTDPNLHEIIRGYAFDRETAGDVRDLPRLQQAIAEAAPDLIFHLAAQPLVRQAYSMPLEALTTNTVGTAHLLEAVRRLQLPCAIVVVTTDKCYENRGGDAPYREEDPLGGHDVYSASKAAAELVVASWRRSFFEVDPRLGNVASARAGNVIGGGDYSADRLVPDCIRALLNQQPIVVRNPDATRPWQHVLDCLSGYLLLGARLARAEKHTPLASAFNFGPGSQTNRPVSLVVEELLRVWPGGWQPAPDANAPHEAAKLSLAIDKAMAQLDWRPVWEFREAVRHTADWYRERHVARQNDMVAFSLEQIDAYAAAARAKAVAWAAGRDE